MGIGDFKHAIEYLLKVCENLAFYSLLCGIWLFYIYLENDKKETHSLKMWAKESLS